MKKSTAALIACGSALLAAILTFSLTYTVMQLQRLRNTQASAAEAAASAKPAAYDGLYDQAKLDEISGMIDEYFIGEVDADQMTETLAAAMIEGLDDEWSYYIPADEYASYLENVNNSYVGIGVTISWQDEDPRGFLITDVTPDGPAYRAGVEIGDYMEQVEGVPVTELGLTETKNRVRGEEGTDVTITFTRDGTPYERSITRESIKTVNVTYELLDAEIAYIRIRNFEEDSAEDTISAIEAVREQGAKGIIFDVRFNPGGLKRELVELLDYLLPEGPLFRSVNYLGVENVDYSDAYCVELPMAVLVNVDSYSAAEFFAAALQEYEAATVVGTQTYGKGYFQTALRLSDGSAINISVGKYTTPNGVSLVGVGITPDQVVEISDEEYADLYYSRLDRDADRQLQAAIEALQQTE